jgi:DNA-binding PadR family transcriptional regulator
VTAPIRVTGPLLDIVELFLRAWQDQVDLHGWQIMKEARLTGPTTIRVLDQLEDHGWITGMWDRQGARPGQPRVRLYRLTPTGQIAARELVAEQSQMAQRRARWRTARPGLAQRARLRLAGT